MDPFTISAIIAITAAVASTAVTTYGQSVTASAQREQEDLRKRQMNLEAARQRRQAARETAQQRAVALTMGATQGASGSSGVAGSLADIGNVGAGNLEGIRQGQQIGNQMFAANVGEARGNSITSAGQAIGSLGEKVSNGITLYSKIATPVPNRSY